MDKRRRENTAKYLWRWMKRRAAIEPGIGHLKREHWMDRCSLKGVAGDQVNMVLSAAGMNSGRLPKAVALLPVGMRLLFAHLIEVLKQNWRSLRLQNLPIDRKVQITAVA